MTISLDKRRSYEKLLLIPIIIVLLCSASMVGIGYSSLSSDVVNSGNAITFVRINDSHVDPTGPNSDLILPPTSNPITIDGVDYPSYNIEFIENPGNNVPLNFDLQGAFCFYLNVTKPNATFTINGDTYNPPKGTTGYHTLIDHDNNPATKPILTKKTFPEIINGNGGNGLWITSNTTSTFSFHWQDANSNNFLMFVFKE